MSANKIPNCWNGGKTNENLNEKRYKKWLIISERLIFNDNWDISTSDKHGNHGGWSIFENFDSLDDVLELIKSRDAKAYYRIEYIFSIDSKGNHKLEYYGLPEGKE